MEHVGVIAFAWYVLSGYRGGRHDAKTNAQLSAYVVVTGNWLVWN